MYNVFVTGVTGLLGTNLTIDLLNNGYKVFGLLRETSKYHGPNHENLTLVRGSLFDDFSALFKHIDYVIHIAAITQQNINQYSTYQRVNCKASLQLLHAAIQSKVKRFIFISSANTMGFGNLLQLGQENHPIKPPFSSSYYAQSKLEAEKELLKHKNEIDLVILNPTFMIGAYDTKPSSGKIILMGLDKKIIFYPPGGKNFVHVKDVSHGIIKSLTQAKTGERYLLAHENISYKDFFKKVNDYNQQNPKMIKIPLCILKLIGYIGDVLRFFRIKTNLSSSNMTALSINNYYSNSKSINVLGVNYQPVEYALKDAIEYFKDTKQ